MQMNMQTLKESKWNEVVSGEVACGFEPSFVFCYRVYLLKGEHDVLNFSAFYVN